MGDYYHHFLSSMSGAGMNPMNNPDEMFAPPMQGAPIPMGAPVSMPGPYQQLGYFAGFPEPMMFNTGKPPKGRRKSSAGFGPGAEHVKHRRTRSGCFMCRSRRVKVRTSRRTPFSVLLKHMTNLTSVTKPDQFANVGLKILWPRRCGC